MLNVESLKIIVYGGAWYPFYTSRFSDTAELDSNEEVSIPFSLQFGEIEK